MVGRDDRLLWCRQGAVLLEVDGAGQDLDPGGSGIAGACGQIAVAAHDEAGTRHQAVDLVAQQAPHQGISGLVVVVEDGVIEVQHVGNAIVQKPFFQPEGQVGQQLLLDPEQVEAPAACDGGHLQDAPGQQLQAFQIDALPAIHAFQVVIVEQREVFGLDAGLMQHGQVLKGPDAGGSSLSVVTGQQRNSGHGKRGLSGLAVRAEGMRHGLA